MLIFFQQCHTSESIFNGSGDESLIKKKTLDHAVIIWKPINRAAPMRFQAMSSFPRTALRSHYLYCSVCFSTCAVRARLQLPSWINLCRADIHSAGSDASRAEKSLFDQLECSQSRDLRQVYGATPWRARKLLALIPARHLEGSFSRNRSIFKQQNKG